LTVLLASLLVFILYLIYERIMLNRRRASLPLVIAVTGTRGKSGVVRMLASVLRADGRKVLAKSTGSQASYILPGGDEKEIPRRGAASIIEQKDLVRKAVDYRADAVVAEIMSIHPENHYVESQKILRPDVVVFTNVRRDHVDAMGSTEGEIAAVLGLDFYKGSAVFLPESEGRQAFREAAAKTGAELIPVGVDSGLQNNSGKSRLDFNENIGLVYAAARYLGIDDSVTGEGIRNALPDIGAMDIRRIRFEEGQKKLFTVSAFAANDPDSTARVLEKALGIIPNAAGKVTGLLVLRRDRPDRTAQWIDALQNGWSKKFVNLYVAGDHAHIVKRRVENVRVVRNMRPDEITHEAARNAVDGSVIFGIGNMVGTGRAIAEYWKETGDAYVV